MQIVSAPLGTKVVKVGAKHTKGFCPPVPRSKRQVWSQAIALAPRFRRMDHSMLLGTREPAGLLPGLFTGRKVLLRVVHAAG